MLKLFFNNYLDQSKSLVEEKKSLGGLVVDFVKDSINKYAGEHKEELADIVKLANQDDVNSLLGDQLSSSRIYIQ